MKLSFKKEVQVSIRLDDCSFEAEVEVVKRVEGEKNDKKY
jgi:hypothetical protein